jgi:branched-chain amino acid transport system ATP-binding protein
MTEAVLDIGSFTVAAGEIVALLGPNGAGKTALIETILGFRPSSQTIRLLGQDVTALPVEQRVALGIGYVPERRRLFAGLTVAENLEASSRLPGRSGGGGSRRCWRCSRCSASGPRRAPGCCRAASSRCWRWRAP